MLWLPPHNIAHATIMQPFQCDLQAQLQDTHRTTHTGTKILAKPIGGTNRVRNDRSRNRRTDEVSSSPAATSHVKTRGFVLRLPPHNIAHATFMQPFQCDLQPQLQETHRTTHTGTKILAKHIGGTNRVRNDRTRNRRTDEVPSIAAYSHFTRKNTRFRAPASSPQHSPCNIHAAITMRFAAHSFKKRIELRTQEQPLRHHCPSSPLTFVTTPLHHHFPSSPLPFLTTSLLHHFPSSPLPFRTTSLPHHFPSSPLPFVTTSFRHHSPSSPLPFFTTSLPHHSPSSSLPFVTTSLRYHSPSSSLPFFTTSLPHHFPSSPLPFLTTSLLHHFPSSRTTLHRSQFNSIASYSFLMY